MLVKKYYRHHEAKAPTPKLIKADILKFIK